MLSQPGQYACEERVKVEGPKGSFPAVSILGPTRSETQLEVSYADARTLGIPGVLRMSGDIAGTPGFKVTGPCGSVELKEGRHRRQAAPAHLPGGCRQVRHRG